jgi:hypothetical protein
MTDLATTTTPAPTSPSSEPVVTSPAPAAAAPAAPAAASPPGTTSPSGEPAKRPEGLPEQFWDEKGGLKVDDLTKHLGELTALKAAHDSKLAAMPEKPDGYELKLPADLKFEGGDGFTLDPNDPLVNFGREVAHAMGADQAGFEKIVGMYAQQKVAETKLIEGLAAKQTEALGPKGAERQSAVKNWIAAKLGPDALPIFEGPLVTKVGVEKLEALMRLASGGGMPSFTPVGRERGDDAKTEFEALPPGQRTGRQGFAFVRNNVKQG